MINKENCVKTTKGEIVDVRKYEDKKQKQIMVKYEVNGITYNLLNEVKYKFEKN